jgi:transposase
VNASGRCGRRNYLHWRAIDAREAESGERLGKADRARQSVSSQNPRCAGFPRKNPRVRFHFTPTYSSWLNQVEIWFVKIERDVIARGVLTSVADLSRKLMKYIRAYAKSATPFNWKYTDVSRRIVTK